MKKNKGFTLIELIAVAVILAMIAIIAIPTVLNQIQNSKGDISKTMKEAIYSAASLYVDANPDAYTKENGEVYCITLKEMMDQNFLKEPLQDPSTGSEISSDKMVRATVQNEVFSFEFRDSCIGTPKYEKTIDYLKKICVPGEGDIVWVPNDKIGTVTTPNYPEAHHDFWYSNNTYRSSKKTVATKVVFSDVSVELDPQCRFDYLSTYDWNQRLIETICGKTTRDYIVPGNQFAVQFSTDQKNSYQGYSFQTYTTNDCRALDQLNQSYDPATLSPKIEEFLSNGQTYQMKVKRTDTTKPINFMLMLGFIEDPLTTDYQIDIKVTSGGTDLLTQTLTSTNMTYSGKPEKKYWFQIEQDYDVSELEFSVTLSGTSKSKLHVKASISNTLEYLAN